MTNIIIRDVWRFNLEDEIKRIREIVDNFPYISFQTKYPGVFMQPHNYYTISNVKDKYYAKIRENVHFLNLFQLGLCFFDEQGNLPCSGNIHFVWQFNFSEFNRYHFAKGTLEILNLSGINFERNIQMGVDANKVAEALISSGIVMNDGVQWVTFDGGYNFGYIIKLLTGKPLPKERREFFNLMEAYFPFVYDAKHMMKLCDGLHVDGDDGLHSVAESLGVEKPVGMVKQSGLDSVLTCGIFKVLKQNYFNGSIDENINRLLYNLGVEN